MKDENKKGLGLLIGIGAPKPKDEGAYEESEDDSRELKLTAADALLSAFEAGDREALVDALDAYMEC